MRLKIATWNINSVRLRLPQVLRFLAESKTDILCLQETKCPDDRFPLADFAAAGFGHAAHLGQKGYNGVAILSRLPFSETASSEFCGRADARHISVTLGAKAKAAAGLVIHNLYVPAGGDIPDPQANPRFAHKLAFLEEMHGWSRAQCKAGGPRVVVGDLNVAPLEHDVWSHRQLLSVVSHTPEETRRLTEILGAGDWLDAVRRDRPQPEKVYSWWSYRSPDWEAADRGRRLDHIWLSPDAAPALTGTQVHKETRGWAQPSDHVPIVATLSF
jgi:exodeoxyribonuclease-3